MCVGVGVCWCVCVCVCVGVCVHTYIFEPASLRIYIYTERERERETVYIYIYIYIYIDNIYIYTCINMNKRSRSTCAIMWTSPVFWRRSGTLCSTECNTLIREHINKRRRSTCAIMWSSLVFEGGQWARCAYTSPLINVYLLLQWARGENTRVNTYILCIYGVYTAHICGIYACTCCFWRLSMTAWRSPATRSRT